MLLKDVKNHQNLIELIPDTGLKTDYIEVDGKPVIVYWIGDPSDPSVGIWETDYTPFFETIEALDKYCADNHEGINRLLSKIYECDWDEKLMGWVD